jgi:hypothetical protein
MQTKVIPMPSDFKVPFKEGFQFELNGIVMQVYEIKRPKPNPRFLVKAVGLIVPIEPVNAEFDGVEHGQSPAN